MRAYAADAERLATPAGRKAIVAYITRLRAHYPPSAALGEQLEAAVWEDWFADLAEVPVDVLSEACGRWRNSAERWAPTPGQLKALIGPGETAQTRRWLAGLAREAIAELEGGR